ncbi:MAG TPA: hypothetical protein VEV63_01880 [Streptosporangiaceae bacterium]|nr:hypothetical protein [Streptosporangiaceae bacterium]
MTNTDCPPRLAVVAAIIDGGATSLGPVASAARLGAEIHDKEQSAMAARSTPAERALAQALRDGGQRDGTSTDHAIAELLLLAADDPEAGRLATGLRQAFLRPDNSKAVLAREERRSAFTDLYRRLALHQLDSQVRNKAAATLCRLNSL